MNARHAAAALVPLSLGACLALASAACGEDAGATADPGDACEAAAGVTVTGVVEEYELGVERQQYEPLPDVTVCVFDAKTGEQAPCATTNDAGTFALCGVKENARLLLSYEREDYVKALRMLSTREEDYQILVETVLGPVQLSVDQVAQAGGELTDVSGGAVQFFAAEPGDGVLQAGTLEGFTAALQNEDGSQADCTAPDGHSPCTPIYIGEDGMPDVALTASSRLGVGAFGNVPPGEYLLRIAHPELACDSHLPESGWRADDPDVVRVKVVAEWITSQVGAFCQPPE